MFINSMDIEIKAGFFTFIKKMKTYGLHQNDQL